jgi:hypothetical protein
MGFKEFSLIEERDPLFKAFLISRSNGHTSIPFLSAIFFPPLSSSLSSFVMPDVILRRGVEEA